MLPSGHLVHETASLGILERFQGSRSQQDE